MKYTRIALRCMAGYWRPGREKRAKSWAYGKPEFLFDHQNFPGQFRQLAPALLEVCLAGSRVEQGASGVAK